MGISNREIDSWCEAQSDRQLSLLKELAAIPAPSHREQARAEFICRWLKEKGAKDVSIDTATNVVLPLGDPGSNGLLVCMAHTDVVFPDMEPLPVRKEGNHLYAPGVGDDTANVVALMLCAQYFLQFPEQIPQPMLFVFNSCEEGLGNLKGVRQIMSDYAGRISALVSFDLQSDSIVSRAVGSQRWEVQLSTKGGHSYSDFGTPNAIHCLSRIIDKLYQQPVPQIADSKTTYNVGIISGGTSVNTIAQSARMIYEYRSNDASCLSVMAEQFHRLIEDVQRPDAKITLTPLGDRPCGGAVPHAEQEALLARCADAVRSVYDIEPALCSASTDANIPLSLGIPAATFGLYRGGGAHTREEYVLVDSLTPGLKIAMHFFLSN